MDAPEAPESYETLYEEYEGDHEAPPLAPGLTSGSRSDERFQAEPPSARDEFESYPVRSSVFGDDAGLSVHVPDDDDNPRRRRGAQVLSALVGLFFTVAILGALVAGAWYFQPQIIALVPQAEALYALVPVEETIGDYDLQNTGYIELVEDGRRVLVVSGEVVNLTDQPIGVPVIQVTVRTIDGEDLDRWRFKPPGDDVNPGEARYFETRRLDPPRGAQRLHLIVVEDD